MVYYAPGVFSSSRKAGTDGAIVVNDSPNTKVEHNTVLTNGNLNLSVEFRFPGTTGAIARNNLVDAPIRFREGLSFTNSNNVTNATSKLFVNPSSGDLHLAAATSPVTLTIDVPLDFDGAARSAITNAGADQFGATQVPGTASSGSVVVATPISASPTASTGSLSNTKNLTIAWDPSPGPDVSGYIISQGMQSLNYTSRMDVGNTTSRELTGLADGTTYFFAVQAYNAAGLLSELSQEISTTTSSGAPSIICPVVSASSSTGSPIAVSFASPSTTGGAAPVSTSCTPSSGSMFPVGTTPLTCTAKDAANKSTSCTTVVLVTAAAPALSCPTIPSAVSPDGNPVVVNFASPTATGGAQPLTTSCTPQSGTKFPVGSTSVTCQVTDAQARTASCSSTAVVTAPAPVTLKFQSDVNGSITVSRVYQDITDGVTSNWAVVSWATNLTADSQVEFGTSTSVRLRSLPLIPSCRRATASSFAVLQRRRCITIGYAAGMRKGM